MARSDELCRFFKGMSFLSPWLIGFSLFTLLPIAMVVYLSFCDYPLVQPPVWVGMQNFIDLWHDAVFWEAFRNSLYYMAFALPAGLLVSLSVALLLNQKVPGQSIFRTLVYLPSLIPTAAAAVLWLWLLDLKNGVINLYLRYLGISGPGWLTSDKWVIPSLVMISIWGIGNTVIIYLAGLQDVPRELYEAADLDGASPVRRLWHVTLPMISPIIFFNLVTAIIAVLQLVDLPYIMTQGGPGYASYFLGYYIYVNTMQYSKMGISCAIAWIQLAIVLVLTVVAFGTSRRWVYYQGK